jgi:hypothetical protein
VFGFLPAATRFDLEGVCLANRTGVPDDLAPLLKPAAIRRVLHGPEELLLERLLCGDQVGAVNVLQGRQCLLKKSVSGRSTSLGTLK